jgi:hypothetical protein
MRKRVALLYVGYRHKSLKGKLAAPTATGLSFISATLISGNGRLAPRRNCTYTSILGITFSARLGYMTAQNNCLGIKQGGTWRRH